MKRLLQWSVLLFAVAVATNAALAGQITGPFAYGDLNVFLSRPDAGVPHGNHDYVSIEAALAEGTLRISDSGRIDRLIVENNGDRPVLLQVGDLLTGGKQDRVVKRSLRIAARSGPIPIDVLCVEATRWGGSGMQFNSAGVKMPYATHALARGQLATWKRISDYQHLLAKAVGKSVTDPHSPSSLPRTLSKLSGASAIVVGALRKVPLEGATGYVAVKNGHVVAAEQFQSAGLLRQSWPKLIQSAAVASFLAPSGSGSVTSIADVKAFVEDSTKAGRVIDVVESDGALLHRVFNIAR